MDIYEPDFDIDDITAADAFIIACSLLNNDMPVPIDIVTKLHTNGIYIAN